MTLSLRNTNLLLVVVVVVFVFFCFFVLFFGCCFWSLVYFVASDFLTTICHLAIVNYHCVYR